MYTHRLDGSHDCAHLPRRAAPLTLSNWRPISLYSTLYKMYAKMYASCMNARITAWALEGAVIRLSSERVRGL